ncbi:MAG: sulfite exporter TauE/SafE family protein [Methanomicrobia archaeon]|nr:sulfite exporter TauE/SafE family protein [Methanomicrobia archaeon]
MIDPLIIAIIGFFVIFLGSLTQGLIGFGVILFSAPIMILFLPAKIVVPMIMIYSALINATILFEARKWVDLKRIWLLIIAGMIGVPIGTYLLIVLDDNILRMFIGSIIILFAAALLTGFKKKIKNEKLAFPPIGFIGGLLGGSTSMSGPPVILFFTNQGLKKQVFRANLVAYFMAMSLVAISSFIVGGLIITEVIRYTILFLPAMIFGVVIGIKLVHRVEEKLFQNIVLIVVIVAGVLSVISGLGIL